MLDNPGPDLVDLVIIGEIFGLGLLCGHFGTEAPLAGKGNLLGQGELLIGHGLLKSPGVHRQFRMLTDSSGSSRAPAGRIASLAAI